MIRTVAALPARPTAALLALVALSLLVAGCGRRGAPEPPPSATVVTTDEQGNVIEQPASEVDRPFILDPLL